MINTSEILQTVRMITEEKLDIRTITMGISLYDCVHPDRDILYRNVYDRITTQAKDLVRTGEALEREFGIPSTRAFPPRPRALWRRPAAIPWWSRARWTPRRRRRA